MIVLPARLRSVDGFEKARFVQELPAGDLLGKDGMDFWISKQLGLLLLTSVTTLP